MTTLGAHTHSKDNNSPRARQEKLKAESKKQGKSIHGEGMKNPSKKAKPKFK